MSEQLQLMSADVITPVSGSVMFPELEPEPTEVVAVSIVAAVRELTTQAKTQEWRLATHQRFVTELGTLVAQAIETSVNLINDPRSLAEPAADLGPADEWPCSNDLKAFDHVVEVDHDATVQKEPRLIERARALCASCPVKTACLEHSYTEPRLEPGMWGGLSRNMRKPEWEARASLRQKVVNRLYADVSVALLGIIKVNNDENVQAELKRIFATVSQKYIVRPEAAHSSSDFHIQHELVVEVCLGSPLIRERAFLLLSRLPSAMLTTWLHAAFTGAAPQYERAQLAEAGQVSLDSLYRRLASVEEHVVETVTRLAAGTFDYHDWQKSYAQDCQKSALAFLARINEPIPAQASLNELKQLAVERLALLTSRQQAFAARTQNILFDYYGLGTAPSVDAEALAKKYGGSPKQIMKLIKTQALRLKTFLAAGGE